jgi:hypothetical protein
MVSMDNPLRSAQGCQHLTILTSLLSGVAPDRLYRFLSCLLTGMESRERGWGMVIVLLLVFISILIYISI